MKTIKQILHKLVFFNSIRKIKQQDKVDLKNWLRNGLKLPPPEIIKHNIILKYAKKEKIHTFIANKKYINSREIILKLNFENIVKCDNYQSIIEKNYLIKNNSIIWINSEELLQFKTKKEIVIQIKKIIKSATQTNHNHVMLWDNAHLFLKNSNFPNVQEFKIFFLQERPFYNAMKTENNIFVMAPKL